MGLMLTIIKVFIILFLLCLWGLGTPGRFQNKSVSFFPNQCLGIFSSWRNWRGEEGLFLESARREAASYDYPQKHLVVIRDKKVSPFVKFKIIPTLLCYLLDSFTYKYCRAWNSMINLWIEFRTFKRNSVETKGKV